MEQSASESKVLVVEPAPVEAVSVDVVPDVIPEPKPVEEYAATDREMIVFFFASDVGHIHKIKTPGYKTVFYFDKSQVEPLIKIWQSPVPIVMDIRKVFQAERIFNAAVHDDA